MATIDISIEIKNREPDAGTAPHVQIRHADGTGGNETVRPRIPGHGHQLVHLIDHDRRLADGQASAAAVRLVGPGTGIRAHRGHDAVHQDRVLVIVELAYLRRSQEKAAVIGNRFQARELLADLFFQGVYPDIVIIYVDGIPHLDGFAEFTAQDRFDLGLQFPVLFEIMLGRLQAVEAGGAGNHYVRWRVLLRSQQIAGRKGDGQFEVGVVGGCGAAAGPAIYFNKIDSKR